MLILDLTLPGTNAEGAEDVNNSLANLNFHRVTDKFVHCSSFEDIVLQGIVKLFISFHGVDISNHSNATNKDLGLFYARINGRCIGVYGIYCNRFIVSVYISAGLDNL